MKKTFKILILFLVLIILGMNNKIYAATTSIRANNNTVNVGDEITITATVTAAQWDLKIKLNGTTLAQSSELENYESNITKTITAKYKATQKGKLEFTLEGDITDVNQENRNIRDKVQVTVNEKATTPEKPTTPTQPSTTEEKSSEARLKTFGIRPDAYDFSGFSKNRNKEDWSVTVPNDVTEVEVYGTPLGKNAKVEGTGKVKLKEGNNTISVKVTAEAGNTKIYKLTIKRKTSEEQNQENGEVRLKSLGIKPEEYDFSGFDSEKTEYNVEVPNNVKEIEVYATAMDSNAQITGTGMIELKEGKNELKVEVISANGEKKIYTLIVTRKNNSAIEKLGLSTLSITEITLTPNFKSGIYEYKVDLTKELTALEIQAKANEKDATIEIIGNENLKQGENVITILVKSKNTDEVATYQIIVNKNVIEEKVQANWLNPSTWGKEEIIKIAIILVLIILIVCAVILKINLSKQDEKENEVDFPGAEELDKAIAEHQELSEEPKNIQETEEENNIIHDIEIDDERKHKKRGRHF